MDRRLRPSSVIKHRAITEAAIDVFVADGFDDASMDEIARRSGVSKQTIYAHFGGKDALFIAVVGGAATGAFDEAHQAMPDPEDPEEMEPYLTHYAETLLRVALHPRIMGVRRLAIGEARRFPDVTASFRRGGMVATTREMAVRLERFHRQGLLWAPDSIRAARTLNWLILADPLNEAMLNHDHFLPDEAKRAEIAKEAARVFYAAHRPTAD